MAFKFNPLTGEFNVVNPVTAPADPNAIYRDGSQPPTANIPWNSKKITGLADGTAAGDAVNKGQLDLYIPLTQKAAALGVATLDGGGKVPVAQLPSSVMEYFGNWDASTNTPILADGTGNNGDTYRASVAGTQNLGSGPQTWGIGDLVIYNGSIWQKAPAADGVSSVNGFTGAVVLTTTNIAEGTNLYYLDSRARAAVSATTPLSYNSGTGIFSIQLADSTHDGYLSQTDWAIFNSKQAAGSYITALTGEVTASGPGSVAATISNAAVIAKVLTGFVSGAGTVSSADSILGAFQKIDGNVAGKANTALSNLASTAINANLLFGTDAANDIGASGANRPGTIYVANNVNIALNAAQTVLVSGPTKNVTSSSVSSASLLYILNSEGLASVTLNDNQVTPLSTISYTAASFSSIRIEYSITRGAGNAESGQMNVITDGTSAGINQTYASIGSSGVTFTVDINAGSVRVLYTSTSTGTAPSFKFTVQKWLA